jgi:hypothetical protein
MDVKPRYDEPFYWWGPGWEATPARGIGDLLRDGTIDAGTAALLWAALSRRRSLAVIASASGAGKTTLLTALLELLPESTRRVYLRGCFETFAFLADPAMRAGQTALLANEISPHLPVYLWGPAVGRALALATSGFALLTTAHAGSVHEFVGTLTGSPLRLPTKEVAAIEFVTLLEASRESASGRQVRGLWRLRETRDGVAIESAGSVTTGGVHDISLQDTQKPPPTSHSAPWFPQPEIGERCRVLRELEVGRIAGLTTIPVTPRAP